MGYRDYFMPKVKWAKVPFKDLNDSHDGEEGGDGDSESSSTLLEEKSNKQSTFRRNVGRLVWLLHIALLASNITWWLTWNTWAHPADSHSMLKYLRQSCMADNGSQKDLYRSASAEEHRV